jgi:hypothetical protein
MGIAIQCILEQHVPGVPRMEGKALAMAYFADPRDEHDAQGSSGANIIAVDFRGGKPQAAPSHGTSPKSLLAPLDTFIAGDGSSRFNDAAKGLTAVRSILKRLRDGVIVAADRGFNLGASNDDDLTEGVQFDLEELEKMLVCAQKAGIRFYLTFSV